MQSSGYVLALCGHFLGQSLYWQKKYGLILAGKYENYASHLSIELKALRSNDIAGTCWGKHPCCSPNYVHHAEVNIHAAAPTMSNPMEAELGHNTLKKLQQNTSCLIHSGNHTLHFPMCCNVYFLLRLSYGMQRNRYLFCNPIMGFSSLFIYETLLSQVTGNYQVIIVWNRIAIEFQNFTAFPNMLLGFNMKLNIFELKLMNSSFDQNHL